tara:strand:+ start:105 stop:323 length:219 start_codon:yes stop_codon:yes gene_type:complete
MDSLLTRLKEEYRVELIDMRDEYPATYDYISNTLANNLWTGNLKLTECLTICEFLTDNRVELYDINELFKKD